MEEYQCPGCGKAVLPHRYAGSPLSGRVDLEGLCSCGWKGFESVTGWVKRGEALRVQIDAARSRSIKFKLLHPLVKPTKVGVLLEWWIV